MPNTNELVFGIQKMVCPHLKNRKNKEDIDNFTTSWHTLSTKI